MPTPAGVKYTRTRNVEGLFLKRAAVAYRNLTLLLGSEWCAIIFLFQKPFDVRSSVLYCMIKYLYCPTSLCTECKTLGDATGYALAWKILLYKNPSRGSDYDYA